MVIRTKEEKIAAKSNNIFTDIIELTDHLMEVGLSDEELVSFEARAVSCANVCRLAHEVEIQFLTKKLSNLTYGDKDALKHFEEDLEETSRPDLFARRIFKDWQQSLLDRLNEATNGNKKTLQLYRYKLSTTKSPSGLVDYLIDQFHKQQAINEMRKILKPHPELLKLWNGKCQTSCRNDFKDLKERLKRRVSYLDRQVQRDVSQEVEKTPLTFHMAIPVGANTDKPQKQRSRSLKAASRRDNSQNR